jgi:hypothetical protein
MYICMCDANPKTDVTTCYVYVCIWMCRRMVGGSGKDDVTTC